MEANVLLDMKKIDKQFAGVHVLDKVDFEKQGEWEDPLWGIAGDRVEKLYDESRDSWLTINYFDSEDGVCRTAFASIEGQGHEFRRHTCDNAWQFISKFTR